jgi:aminomethyltransferase
MHSMTLKATPLHSAHRAAGAKMVDFGGWDMPVNYGSQIQEHEAVRADAGMFDVSHMCVLDLQGANVRPFLRGLLANNVDKLQTAGKALYSCMLNPQGGVIDDLIVYFIDEHWFRLVVNAGTAEKDIAWIRERNETSGSGLSITPRRADLSSDGIALIAVQGPNARARFWETVPATRAASESLKPFNAAIVADTPFGELMVARTGYTGEDGFEVGVAASRVQALWDALAANGVKPAGLGARDTLRLEAGMNLYGQDMDDSVSPLDAGLAWTVDLASERDFVGKAALQRGQKQQFVGLILREKGGILRAHQKVVAASGDAGEITSGTFSPSMQQAIALARVPMDVQPGDTVHVEIRDKRLAASVVKLPFVRHGKIMAA